MAVSYTLLEPRRTRRALGRPATRVRCAAAALCAATAVACASGAPLPRGAPPLAPGSTPEPVRYEVIVPGTRPEVRERLVRLLSDSLYHVNPTVVGYIAGYNLARLVKVRVDLSPVGKDSIRVGLTGETYAGDTTRRDTVSGLPERWRLITATDGGTAALRDLARAVRSSRSLVGVGEEAGEAPVEATHPPLGTTGDPAVAAFLATTPVGRAREVCRSSFVPTGWLILYWFLDRSRCTDLPDTRYPDEPNVMRIEREW
jgi:hypothetical protein